MHPIEGERDMRSLLPPLAACWRAAAVAGVVMMSATGVLAEAKIGQAAPEFAVKDSRGANVQLSAYKGKTVILEWTNHQCPYVGKHYGSGNMQALQKETTDKGIVWLTVISSAPGTQGHVDGKAADELTRSRKAHPNAVVLDEQGTVGRAYGARATPHMYIVDKSGTLVYAGAIDDKPTSNKADIATAHNYVRQALADMDKGTPVKTASTRAYGCSIKYD